MINPTATVGLIGNSVHIKYNDLAALMNIHCQYISRRAHWIVSVVTIEGIEAVLVEEDEKMEFLVHWHGATEAPPKSVPVSLVDNEAPTSNEDLAAKLAALML